MYKWEEEVNSKDTLWLFTKEEYKKVPDGTILLSVNRLRREKGKDVINMDIRFGCLAYGLTPAMAEEQNLGPLFTSWMLKS